MNIKTLLIISSASIFLVGCGGSSTVKPTADQTFSDLTYGTQYEFDSVSQSFSYTQNTSETYISSLSVNPQRASGSKFTYGSTDDGSPSYVNIYDSGTGANLTLDSTNDIFITTDGLVAAANTSGTEVVAFIRPSLLNWNYQTFGIWDKDTSGTRGNGGVMSIGITTPASSVPTSGSGRYIGLAAGYKTQSDGRIDALGAVFNATANFSSRTINASTYSSLVAIGTTGSIVSSPQSDTSGVLTYSSDNNNFSGTMSTSAGWSGPAAGRFYGPNAEEMGGIIQINGPGLGQIGIGFGAQR